MALGRRIGSEVAGLSANLGHDNLPPKLFLQGLPRRDLIVQAPDDLRVIGQAQEQRRRQVFRIANQHRYH